MGGKYLSLFFLLIFFLSYASAQTEEKEVKTNLLEKGSWSLQFQISQNFTLKSFQDGMISAKYHFSKKTALRLALSFKSNNYDNEQDCTESYEYMIRTINRNYGDSGYAMEISSGYLYYPRVSEDIYLFIGSGPLFKYSTDSYNAYQSTIDTSAVILDRGRDDDEYGIGLLALIGVEWFVKRNISLIAEYHTSFTYYWREGKVIDDLRYSDQDNVIRKEKIKYDNYYLDSFSVFFGISVYLK